MATVLTVYQRFSGPKAPLVGGDESSKQSKKRVFP